MNLVTYTDVVREASNLFRVHPRDLTGKAQFNFIMPARFGLYKALHLRGNSYSQIGRWFDRDHSTIIHGTRRADEIMQDDLDYRAKVLALTRLKNPMKEQTDGSGY